MAFRDTIDQVIATVKQQFYQILLNRALVGVQEESVKLLQSQLQDQQNRFEAGTVPRFNVLQAQVALSNQYPVLITAQNNYRISQLQLAKTLGLDFDPARGDGAPLEAVGELHLSAAPHAARYGNRSRQGAAAVFETAKSDHAVQCRAGAGGALRIFPDTQRQRR